MPKSNYRFSPSEHESQLTGILQELLQCDRLDPAQYESVLRRHPKAAGGFFSKSEIIRGFRHLNQKLEWNLEERPVLERLRMKPVRTQSGVAPVTVLTKPYPCPGRCIFCPSDLRMPKSYLSAEPGAQRAARHRFDPFRQTLSRLRSYHNTGHKVDKVGDGGLVTHVELYPGATDGVGHRLGGSTIEIGHDHKRAFRCEAARQPGADAATATRHDHNSVLQFHGLTTYVRGCPCGSAGRSLRPGAAASWHRPQRPLRPAAAP